MCCFARSVLAVIATKIFGRLTGRGTQYLVYQMQYESEEPNAMILPLPVRQPAREDSLKFIDLSGYESFFDDLAMAFPFQIDGEEAKSKSKEMLDVVEVGDYVASFVPTIDDFDRLDEQFVIPKSTWLKIPGYENFGFAVFQLKALSTTPHPMAFEFETASDGIFFPTVHIHDGEVHEREDFDHALYMQHAGLDSIAGDYVSSNVKDDRTGLVRSKSYAGRYCKTSITQDIVDPNLLIHRLDLHGKMKNEDKSFEIDGDPITPRFSFRKFTRYWPVAAGAMGIAAVAWFFRRRSRIQNADPKGDSIEW